MTGLFEVHTLAIDLEMFPNPAKDWLRVSISEAPAGEYQLQLIDITGKIVLEREWDIAGEHFQRKLDIADLHIGQYVLKISHGDGVSSRMFLKR